VATSELMCNLYALIRRVPLSENGDAQYEEALHLIQAGDALASVPYFQAAVESSPKTSQYWVSFIAALIIVGQRDEARLVLSFAVDAGLDGSDCEQLTALIDGAAEISRALNVDELLKLFSEQAYSEVELKVKQQLELNPNWLVGWKILTDTLLIQKKDAKYAAQRALALNVDDAQEHCYYGMILKGQGDLVGAVDAYRQAIQLKPDYAAAYNNLGIVKKDLGDIDSAVDCYRQALILNPSYASCFSNLLFCYSHSNTLDAQALFDEHCKFSQQYESALKKLWGKYGNDKDANRKLRIGFVSADFREHSLVYFFEPILNYLLADASLELHAYFNQSIEDVVTYRLKNKFARWTQVDEVSDYDLAKKIRHDAIDILVDLDGHTSGNRLIVFAMKPAPVQVSWLGYLATTGLTAMDYYLTDAYLAPPDLLDSQFTEQLIQLPASAAFAPHVLSPVVTTLPSLDNNYLTFACFNRVEKITPDVVDLWSRLLIALPTSKLLLGAMPQEGSYDNILQLFNRYGVQNARLNFYPRSDMERYLKLHQKVDICLDTYPSNGVTTTCHAAWMGVPTLCIAGDRLASRGAMAVMSHLGLQNFVAKDQDDLINKAINLANDLSELVKIRATLRRRFNASALSQPKLVADSLGSEFRLMWSRWCKAEPVKPLTSLK
jgi:predicted O-linked N-acetylglucosamine transferase (SPINDLY family)